MAHGEIDVLQWNVWYQEDIRKIAREIRRIGTPPVLCLQELTNDYSGQPGDKDTWHYLADELGYDCAVDQVEVHGLNEEWVQGIAILSMYKIVEAKGTKLYTPADPFDPHDQARSYLETTLATPDGEFTVATAHLSVASAEREQTGKLRQEADTLEALVQGRQNYSLVGDFNAGLGSSVVAMLSSHLSHAGPDWDVPTWPTASIAEHTGESPRRLDAAFVSPDVDVLSAEKIELDASDHAAIRAKFRPNHELAA